jgi:2-haloacid dehalogenase
MSDSSLGAFEALTFDCYGTLIDWESGILSALQPVLAPRGLDAPGEDLLERFARIETELEAQEYRRYREILAETLRVLCAGLGFRATDEEAAGFAASVACWPAFADSAPGLRRLATRFRLGAITNCDDDLFAPSSRRLGDPFEWIVTAERARSYKPSLHNFELAFETMGLPPERVLHVAQSLYHDHGPAKQLGLTTVWVDRRRGRPGSGATVPGAANPDFTVPDLETLAGLALA